MILYEPGYVSNCCGTLILTDCCEVETYSVPWDERQKEKRVVPRSVRPLTREEITAFPSVEKLPKFRTCYYGVDNHFRGLMLFVETDHDLSGTDWTRVADGVNIWWAERK